MNQSVQRGKRRKTNDLHCSYRNPDQGKGICNNLKTNLFKLHRIKYWRLATTFKHIGLHKSTTQQIIRRTNTFVHLFDEQNRTILGTSGETSQKAFISSLEASASMKRTSAPASANALDLTSASSNDTAWRASVRATITISRPLSLLASTAALIFITASSLDTTLLPRVCPHAFGAT